MNPYRTGVLCGNFTEDRFGREFMEKNEEAGPKFEAKVGWKSEARSNFTL